MKNKLLIALTALLAIFAMAMCYQITILKEQIAEYESNSSATKLEIERLKSIINYFATQNPTQTNIPTMEEPQGMTSPGSKGSNPTVTPGVPVMIDQVLPMNGMDDSPVMIQGTMDGMDTQASEARSN